MSSDQTVVFPRPEGATPFEIPNAGVKLILRTGRRGRPKTLRVTPESKCEEWLRYRTTTAGHTTLQIAGLGPAAKEHGVNEVVAAGAATRKTKTARQAEEQAKRNEDAAAIEAAGGEQATEAAAA